MKSQTCVALWGRLFPRKNINIYKAKYKKKRRRMIIKPCESVCILYIFVVKWDANSLDEYVYKPSNTNSFISVFGYIFIHETKTLLALIILGNIY